MIKDEEGIPLEQQRLEFAIRQLEDVSTLAHYILTEVSVVHMVLQLFCGGPMPFADVPNSNGWRELRSVSLHQGERNAKKMSQQVDVFLVLPSALKSLRCVRQLYIHSLGRATTSTSWTHRTEPHEEGSISLLHHGA